MRRCRRRIDIAGYHPFDTIGVRLDGCRLADVIKLVSGGTDEIAPKSSGRRRGDRSIRVTMEKPPSGTRGGRGMPGFLARFMTPLMIRLHRRAGDRFQGADVLYLSTVGAKTAQPRTTPVVRIADGDSWLICASGAGSINHPGWYHNIVAHPDQVQAEVGGVRHQVVVEQLTGAERERGWSLLAQELPKFAGYADKTDREMPLLRLTPIDR